LGQASIPVLNRTGYSMFWLSSWDSLHHYNKLFNEDMFIRSFFENMFTRKMSTHFYYYKKSHIDFKFKTFVEKYKIHIKYSVTTNQMPRFLRRFYKIPFYWTKVKILRFQHWLIIYFHIFSKNKKIKKKYFFKKVHLSLIRFNRIALKHSILNDSAFLF